MSDTVDAPRDRVGPSVLERVVDRIPFFEKELFLLRQIVPEGGVCIDVGAAGGAHLMVMAASVGPRGRVLGIEPRPGSYRILRRLVRLAGLAGRVELEQVALSADEGSQPLRIPVVPTRAHFHGSSTERSERAAFAGLPARTIEVPTRTLDALVAEHGLDRVDVVKCDVEGAELLVLAGAQQLLRDLRPIVLLEADDLHQARYDATAQDVIDAVRTHDYRVFRYRRGALDEVPGAIEDEDDYLFVPSERRPPLRVRPS